MKLASSIFNGLVSSSFILVALSSELGYIFDTLTQIGVLSKYWISDQSLKKLLSVLFGQMLLHTKFVQWGLRIFIAKRRAIYALNQKRRPSSFRGLLHDYNTK